VLFQVISVEVVTFAVMSIRFPDATPYDTRTKQLLANAIPVLLHTLLQMESADPQDWITLPNEQPLNVHKRADFVIRNPKTNQLIQIELQTYAESNLLERCFVYAAPYVAEYQVIPHQYILHLGKTPANYRTRFQDDWHTFRIEVIDIKRFPADEFLATDIPEAVILAILCASESPERLVEAILERLRALTLDKNRLADYISILDTLGELRDLNTLIKEKAKHMALQFDKTKTFLFQEGKAEGKEEGKEIGIQIGKEEGIEIGKAVGRDETLIEIVREMYADGLPIPKIAKICHLSEQQVREILELP
jgi:predicted transposase/invertase (TIGR01784 family)